MDVLPNHEVLIQYKPKLMTKTRMMSKLGVIAYPLNHFGSHGLTPEIHFVRSFLILFPLECKSLVSILSIWIAHITTVHSHCHLS